MSKTRYLITGVNEAMPIGYGQATEYAKNFEAFLDRNADSRVLCFTEPIVVYEIRDDIIRKVGGEGAQPFQVDADTLFMPLHEKSGDYEHWSYELWKFVDGQWRQIAQEHLELPSAEKTTSWREKPSQL